MKSVGLNPHAEAGGRDLAVGDVHGCFSKLEEALDRVGFDPSVDRLFGVGDLVDRGPESDRVLEWLSRPWFHTVCGNHEFMAFRTALGPEYLNASHMSNGGEWMVDLELEPERLKKVGEALARLPVAMEVMTKGGLIGFVHADCPFDDWEEMRKVEWRQDDRFVGYYDLCLWSYERFERSYQGVIKGVRAVVHGHIVVPKPTVMGNAHFIDTGGWRPGGSFTLLDLETLRPATRRR